MFTPEIWIFEFFISFYFINFLKDFFSRIFAQAILLLYDNFWINAPIFINFSLLEWSSFHLGTIVYYVAMRQFKVVLLVDLNIGLGYKLRKNWFIFKKFRYVFTASNLCLCTKNIDRMLDNFYRDKLKS